MIDIAWRELFRIMGVMGWPWADVSGLTYRQLIQAHDAKLVNQWDQTALLGSLIDGMTTVTINAWGKKKIKPKGFHAFQPYRGQPRQGLRITPGNIQDLKSLGDIVFGKRGKT